MESTTCHISASLSCIAKNLKDEEKLPMIKHKIKPIILTVVLAVTMLFAVAATPEFEVYAYVPPALEQQFFSTATIEDNFCDKTILVMLTKNATREGHFGLQDFAEVPLSSIECITAGFKNGQRVSGNFRRTLRLTLYNPCKQGVLDAVEILEQRPDIHIAEPNFYFYEEEFYEFSYVETFTNNEYVDRSYFWAQDRIGVPQAQAITKGCPSVIVGINDSGIFGTHSSLEHLLVKEMRFGSGDPHNPYNNHGTNSAGLVSSPSTGVAQQVRLASFRHGSIIDSIIHAELHGIRIINRSMAFGGILSRTLHYKIASWDGLYIRAAMNSDRNINYDNALYPDTFLLPNLITVGASDQLDRRVTRTNINPYDGLNFPLGSNYCPYGIRVCIFAPGTNIRTTHGRYGGYRNNYQLTSAAAPLVAGTAALMWSINPNLTAAQVRTLILQTSYGTAQGVQPCITNHSVAGGRLNTYAAVKAARDFVSPLAFTRIGNTTNASVRLQPGSNYAADIDIPSNVVINGLPLLRVTEIAANGLEGFLGSAVTLPSTITYIGDNAFKGTINLQRLVLRTAFPPTISSNTFADVDKFNVELIVPLQAEQYFRDAPFWRDFFWTLIYCGYLEGSGHWYFAVDNAGYFKMIIDCCCYECDYRINIFIIELEPGIDIEFNLCYYDNWWRLVRIVYCGEYLEIIFWVGWGFYFRAFVLMGYVVGD